MNLTKKMDEIRSFWKTAQKKPLLTILILLLIGISFIAGTWFNGFFSEKGRQAAIGNDKEKLVNVETFYASRMAFTLDADTIVWDRSTGRTPEEIKIAERHDSEYLKLNLPDNIKVYPAGLWEDPRYGNKKVATFDDSTPDAIFITTDIATDTERFVFKEYSRSRSATKGGVIRKLYYRFFTASGLSPWKTLEESIPLEPIKVNDTNYFTTETIVARSEFRINGYTIKAGDELQILLVRIGNDKADNATGDWLLSKLKIIQLSR